MIITFFISISFCSKNYAGEPKQRVRFLLPVREFSIKMLFLFPAFVETKKALIAIRLLLNFPLTVKAEFETIKIAV